jgi:hypothetical protein
MAPPTLGESVIVAEARYEWRNSPFGNIEIFNQLWEAADENTRYKLFSQGKMSSKPKLHRVNMERLLAPQTPFTCVIFAIKVANGMKGDGNWPIITYRTLAPMEPSRSIILY